MRDRCCDQTTATSRDACAGKVWASLSCPAWSASRLPVSAGLKYPRRRQREIFGWGITGTFGDLSAFAPSSRRYRTISSTRPHDARPGNNGSFLKKCEDQCYRDGTDGVAVKAARGRTHIAPGLATAYIGPRRMEIVREERKKSRTFRRARRQLGAGKTAIYLPEKWLSHRRLRRVLSEKAAHQACEPTWPIAPPGYPPSARRLGHWCGLHRPGAA